MWWLIIILIILVVFLFFLLKTTFEQQRISEQKKKEAEERRQREFEAEEKRKANERRILHENTVKKYDSLFGTTNAITCMLQGLFARSNAAKDEAQTLKPGDEVNLRLDPENYHDPFAVKVISDRKHIGYIPKEISKEVFEQIKYGTGYYSFVIDQNRYLSTFNWQYETEIELKLYPKPNPNLLKIQEYQYQLDVAIQNGDMEAMAKLQKQIAKIK